MFNGFNPIFNKDSNILILGSFPSIKSREDNFYYANPRNRFWGILEKIFNTSIGTTIKEKTDFLLKYNIALWDIVATCEIVGSLDTNLKCISVVDLNTILSVAPITKILTNGAKSFSLLKKHYPNLVPITTPLPSTSPANAKFDITLWQKELGQIYQ